MKRITIATLIVLLSLCFVGYAFAESATKDECIAKCKEAAEMITKDGIDAAVAEIGKKDGKFVWKDTYVFLMNLDGKMLAHPMKPALTEKDNLLGVKDPDGKALFVEFVKVAKDPGEGWVDYMWPKPGEDKPVPKDTYIMSVPDTDYFVGAGIYR